MDENTRMRLLVELPFLLRVLSTDVVEKAVDLMSGFGVNRREVKYMMALRLGPLTQKELCDLLLLDKANTARAVAVLKRDGLAVSVAGAAGQPAKVALTEKGMEIAGKMSRLFERNIDVTFEWLSNDSIRNLLDSMELMCGSLDAAEGKSTYTDMIKGVLSDRIHQNDGTDP